MRFGGDSLMVGPSGEVYTVLDEDIEGYAHEEFTHEAIAATVAAGQADVGFGIEAAARRYDEAEEAQLKAAQAEIKAELIANTEAAAARGERALPLALEGPPRGGGASLRALLSRGVAGARSSGRRDGSALPLGRALGR